MSRVEGKRPPIKPGNARPKGTQAGFTRRELITDIGLPVASGLALLAVGGLAGYRRHTEKNPTTPRSIRTIDEIETSPLVDGWRDELVNAVAMLVSEELDTTSSADRLTSGIVFVNGNDYLSKVEESFRRSPEQDLPGWNPPFTVSLPGGQTVINTDAVSEFAQQYAGGELIDGRSAEAVVLRSLLTENMILTVLHQDEYDFFEFNMGSGSVSLTNIDQFKDFRLQATRADGSQVFLHGLDTVLAQAIAEIITQRIGYQHPLLSDQSHTESELFTQVVDAAGITDSELKELAVGKRSMEWLLEKVQSSVENQEFLDDPIRSYDQAVYALASFALLHEGIITLDDAQNLLFGETGLDIRADD